MCKAAIKNMTGAMKARDAMRRAGVTAEVVSIDSSLTKRGCSYGVSFPCEKESEARRILNAKNIDYGEILGSSGRREKR